MTPRVQQAYAEYNAAIRAFHEAIAEVYPVGSRVRLAKGNHVRFGSVTEVSCNFVRVHFDDGKAPVWKNVHLVNLDPVADGFYGDPRGRKP